MPEVTKGDQGAGRAARAPRGGRKPARIEDVILAPLHWLERSRGRRRFGLILAYMVVVLLVAGSVWWATSLNGLPDIGDPFDVAAFRASITVPPDEDAFTLYREAYEGIEPGPVASDPNRMRSDAVAGWAKASPKGRRRVEAHREALALWLNASRLDRAQAVAEGQFQALGIESRDADWFTSALRLLDLSLMGILDATRRQEGGDLAGAWDHYLAALRASRHVEMGGTSNHRSIGRVISMIVTPHILRWSERPDLDPTLLRRALSDVQAAAALTPPNSATLKADYLGMIDVVEHSEAWLDFDRMSVQVGYRGPLFALMAYHPPLFRLAKFLKREPERSRRIYRIVYAHYLSQCDLPPGQRIPMVATQKLNNHTHPDFPYAIPPGGLDAAHPLPAEDLYAWFRSTLYGDFVCPPLAYYLPNMDRDRRGLSILILALAERLYVVERGGEPKSGADLVAAGILEQLPEGFEDLEDPARTEPNPESAPED